MQKLLLSGIPKDYNDSVLSGKTLSDDRYPYEQTIVERKILYFEEELVFFLQNQHKSLKCFEAAALRLERNGLGEYKQLKKNSGSTKNSHCFQKINFNELENEERLEAQNSLIKFHIDIEKYRKLFSKRKLNHDIDLERSPENEESQTIKKRRLEE